MNPTIVTIQTLIIIFGATMGTFFIAKYPKSRVHQIAFVLYWLAVGWLASEMATTYYEWLNQLESAWLLRNINKVFTSFMTATIICFAWYFPQKSPNIGLSHMALVYLMALIFSVGGFTNYDVQSALIENGHLSFKYGVLHRIYSVYIVGCAVYTVGFMIRKWKHSSAQITRLQIKYMTISLALALFIGSICSLILPQLGINRFYSLGIIMAPALGMIFWSYAIIRYQAMDIEAVISQTLIWAFVLSLVLIPGYVFIYLAGDWIRSLKNWELTIFATLTFFPFLAYVRKIESYLDRIFRREYYAMQAAMDELMQKTLVLKEIGPLTELIAYAIRTALSVEHASLLYYNERFHGYILAEKGHRRILSSEDEPFLNWLARNDVIIEREQVDLDPKYMEIREPAREYFQAMNSEVCVPLVYENRSIGVLNLGPKGGGNNFTNRDIRLLHRFRTAATVAVANSTLYDSLRRANEEIQHTYISTLDALVAALDLRDIETSNHSRRVVEYSMMIAQSMGIEGLELEHLRWGAMLHDIGKIGIPDAILRKPGPLSAEERKKIEEHSGIGYGMLVKVDFLKDAMPIVLHHHEKYDGSGYPSRLSGDEIPIGARIFAVADAFDAITSDRPYKKARSYEEAKDEIIKNSGTQFDPKAVETFSKLPKERWEAIRKALS